MIVYIVLATVTCLLALMVEQKNTAPCFTENKGKSSRRGDLRGVLSISLIFVLLTAVSALRIAIGHDYWEYKDIFDLISQDRYVSTEFGFNILVRICHFIFGNENYIIIFGIVAFATMLFFMKGLYDQSKNFRFSFFLFMTFGYYLSTFNSIRYYLVLAMAFFAVKYLLAREYDKFVLTVLLASTMHMAVLFVLFAYPLALVKWKKWMVPVVGVFVASLLLFPNFYRRIIFIFYPYYENSIFDTGETSIINIARCAAVLIFALIFYKKALKGNRENMFYFNLSLEALVVYACCSFIPVISRIGFFLNIYQVFLIPNVISSIEKKWLRTALTVCVCIAGVGYFAFFLHTCKDDATRIVPYLNWILN